MSLDAELFQEIGHVGILEDHSDRPDERGLLRNDVIGGNRRDVAARRRKPVDHDHDRFVHPQTHQAIVELLRSGGGAAGTVEVHDHGRRAGFLQPLQRLHAILIGSN